METAINRRSFIKGAALSGLGLGAAALVAGCAPQSAEDAQGAGSLAATGDIAWDKEVDVLVVGSGTGALAALAAKSYGAESVCLIEKGSFWGGSAALSSGGMTGLLSDATKEAGLDDSKEKIMSYYRSASNGRADEEVLESFIDSNNGFLNWCTEMLGWEWRLAEVPYFSDYYEPADGWAQAGRGVSCFVDGEPAGGGSGMWATLQEALPDNGVEVLMETPAEELIVENGRVSGVHAVSSGKDLLIRAQSVILATGGFDYDDEMRRKYLPSRLIMSCAVATNTGDGHKMAMAIGAGTAYMDSVWGAPAILTSAEDPYDLLEDNAIVTEVTGVDWATYRGLPGAVVVNKYGKRFGNEACAYDPFNRTFGLFDSGTMERPNTPAFFLCDSQCWNTYSLPGHEVGNSEVPAWFTVADTLEELAEKMGIDARGLADEISRFNEGAVKGEDRVFHRGEKFFDVNTTGFFAGSRTDIANPTLAPLSTPPYYAAFYVPGTCGTGGGLTINGRAQVLDVSGEPIEGLLACGNCTSGVSGGTYMHQGFSLGAGSVMAWVAARTAAGVE